MASSSGKKRKKQSARKNAASDNDSDEEFYTKEFRTPKCYDRFNKNISRRAIIPDVNLMLQGREWTAIQDNIAQRSWKEFVMIAGCGSQNLTHEFYANAWKHPKETKWPDFVSYVRGKEVKFDAESINQLLKIEDSLDDQNPSYEQFLEDDEPCYATILFTLCRPGAKYQQNTYKTPKSLKTSDLKPIPKAWCLFMLGSILPILNDSEIFMERIKLLYGIVSGMKIDLGKVIANHMNDVIYSKNSYLPYPSLIFLLCGKSGVNIDDNDIQVPCKQVIDGARIDRFQKQYDIKEGKEPVIKNPTTGLSKEQMAVLYKNDEINARNMKNAIACAVQGVMHNVQRLEDIILNLRGGKQVKAAMPMTYHQVMENIQWEDLPPNPYEDNAEYPDERTPAGRSSMSRSEVNEADKEGNQDEEDQDKNEENEETESEEI